MTPEQLAHFESLSGHPSGDEASWRARYAPIIGGIYRPRHIDAPLLSVVIVAWNAAQHIVSCVDHVLAQRGLEPGDVEVVLVDNGKLDSVREDLMSRVHVAIEMAGNVGPSIARNVGVAWSRAPIVAFVDDDGMVAPDYCARTLVHFEDPTLAGVRAKIVAHEHPLFTTLAGHYDRGPVAVSECLITEGAAVVRREVFMDAGGFAEDLFGHEGIELTYRILARHPDLEVLYVPDLILAHDYCDGWSKFIKKNFRYSGVEDRIASSDPDLDAFMNAYFTRRFERDPLPPEQRLARLALIALRGALRLGARARARLKG